MFYLPRMGTEREVSFSYVARSQMASLRFVRGIANCREVCGINCTSGMRVAGTDESGFFEVSFIPIFLVLVHIHVYSICVLFAPFDYHYGEWIRLRLADIPPSLHW